MSNLPEDSKATFVSNRPATVDDIYAIAPHLRAGDIMEMRETAPGRDLQEILWECVCRSTNPRCITINGKPAALMGIVPSAKPLIAVPWLLGTYDVRKAPLGFLRTVRLFFTAAHDYWPILTNVVPTNNVENIRFIEALGFVVGRASVVLINGHAYLPFHRRAPCVQ